MLSRSIVGGFVAGQRPDWDEIPQNEAAGNADFSAQEYAQLLGEELDG